MYTKTYRGRTCSVMKKGILCFFIMVLFISGQPAVIKAEPTQQPDEKQEITRFLNELYAERRALLVHTQLDKLKKFYLPAQRPSRIALDQENRRTSYLNTWAEKRGMKVTYTDGSIRIVRINISGDEAKVSLLQTLLVSYIYPSSSVLPPQSFGVGTRHGLTLKKVDGKWHVLREWYLDPLDDNQNMIPVLSFASSLNEEGIVDDEVSPTQGGWKRKRYNREQAVQYANKYAGAAAMAGNNHRYNQKYFDYTYIGGDCTNFASQALGDPEEGGGLPMSSTWAYRYKQGGTVAWVRTDSFKNFLLYSGYAKLVARGSYDEIAKPTKKFPETALAQLQPGDLIAYELNGDVDHFSIVTARDAKGYVLVNTHTADRYHVPWDLGWDRKTKFLLIKMND